jgi:hypothetical protein
LGETGPRQGAADAGTLPGWVDGVTLTQRARTRGRPPQQLQ